MAPGSGLPPPGLEDQTRRDVQNRWTRVLQQAASRTRRLEEERCGVVGFLFNMQIWDESDRMLTGMLLLAGELPLEGALPVEIHAPLLLLCERGGSWSHCSWGGVGQSRQVVREA